MADPKIQIVMAFPPLLNKMLDLLNFPAPVYRIIDRPTNNVYLRIDTNCHDDYSIFLGGAAGSAEASSQKAALHAIRSLRRKYKISIEDVTTLLRKDHERCIAFYKAKCAELDANHVATRKQEKEQNFSLPLEKKVSVDFIAIAGAILEKIPINASDVETAQLEPQTYTSMITITLGAQPSDVKYIIGKSASTVEGACQNLAKDFILYTVYSISTFNLEILDANYSPTQARLDAELCVLQKRAYLAKKARTLLINEGPRSLQLLEEGDCVTPKAIANQVPEHQDKISSPFQMTLKSSLTLLRISRGTEAPTQADELTCKYINKTAFVLRAKYQLL